MVKRMIGPEDVEEDLSFLERLANKFSSDDDYKSAMLYNQRIQTELLAENSNIEIDDPLTASEVDLQNLPSGLTGTAQEDIPNGDTGRVIFDISGSKYEATVKASGNIQSDEAVIISGSNNQARASPGAESALSKMAGFTEGAGYDLINPGRYIITESNDLKGSNDLGEIEMAPGDTKVIASTEGLSTPQNAIAVGANNESEVRYGIFIDGDGPVGSWTNAPLGTVNSPFSFVKELGFALPAQDQIQYVANYDQDGSGMIELIGRIHAIEVDQ